MKFDIKISSLDDICFAFFYRNLKRFNLTVIKYIKNLRARENGGYRLDFGVYGTKVRLN